MNTESLFKVLLALGPLSETYKEAIERGIRGLRLPRGYYLLEPPRVAEFTYFLNNGLAMSYDYGEKRKEVIDFYGPATFICSPRSFFEQTPSTEFVQLLTPAEVIYFSLPHVLQLFEDFPESHVIFRQLVIVHEETMRAKIRNMKRISAWHRYEEVTKKFPGLSQAASQDTIASYLGITKQSLSRIKKREG